MEEHKPCNRGMVKTEITTLRWSFMLCCKAWVLIVKCNCKLVTYGAVWTISRVDHIVFILCVYFLGTYKYTHKKYFFMCFFMCIIMCVLLWVYLYGCFFIVCILNIYFFIKNVVLLLSIWANYL